MRNPDFERESGLLSLSYDALFLPSGYPKKREGLAALSLIPGKNIEGGGLPASLGRLLWASWPLLRALCSFETLQAPLDVREAFLKPPEKVMELVLVAALVVSFVMALAVSLVMALGHFCFHVAKQFFGLFVFALFAQFIDFAFGLLDELTDFPVLFTFVAFALAIAFAVVLMVALAVVGAVTLTAVTLSGRFAGASSCRSSGVFPSSFSGVSPGPLARAFTGPLARALAGLLAFFFTILLLSQGGQDEQADQGKNGQFGFHELEVVVDE